MDKVDLIIKVEDDEYLMSFDGQMLVVVLRDDDVAYSNSESCREPRTRRVHLTLSRNF
jgi:hypothetical protein